MSEAHTQIRIGILGYGNLGRGVELAITQNSDMELIGIFTRRSPADISPAMPDTAVYSIEQASSMKEQIDVMILCGGSATDLGAQSPNYARLFNIVDSFDTHATIPEHFAAVNAAASASGHTAIISAGWDPGLFSIQRVYAESVLPQGTTYTFWGDGVSQGHSDAIRRIPGVKNAVQYTLPIAEALDQVRAGSQPVFSTREKHRRVCYVVAEPSASQEEIRNQIITMPNYFADYHTTVDFITEEEFASAHNTMPHGGFVLRSGETGQHSLHTYEFSLKLASNPEFTASVLVAYARAAARLSGTGQFGAKTVFDIAPALLSPKPPELLMQELL